MSITIVGTKHYEGKNKWNVGPTEKQKNIVKILLEENPNLKLENIAYSRKAYYEFISKYSKRSKRVKVER